MKKVILTIATVCIATTISAGANANTHISKTMETNLVKVCNALKSDNRLQLRRAVKQTGATFTNIAEGLKCNGESAMDFALNNGATSTADLLAKRANLTSQSMLAKK